VRGKCRRRKNSIPEMCVDVPARNTVSGPRLVYADSCRLPRSYSIPVQSTRLLGVTRGTLGNAVFTSAMSVRAVFYKHGGGLGRGVSGAADSEADEGRGFEEVEESVVGLAGESVFEAGAW
jgi:hypothetical protein